MILSLFPALSDICSVLVTWEDARNKKKPDPYPINLALGRFPSKPKIAYYIGDTPSDILAGRRAGANTVAVSWGLTDVETLRKFAPDFLIA